MKIDDVVWTRELQPEEYPVGTLRYMDRKHCRAAVTLRGVSGVPMTPGPYEGNFVRFDPVGDRGGRHKVGTNPDAPERESDAGDYFIHGKHVAQILKHAQKLFGGIGIYFDTVPSVMIHLDNRPQPVNWLRVDGQYIDYNVDPARYCRTLAEELGKLPPQEVW